jgi:uncharacterized membrane protein YqjE
VSMLKEFIAEIAGMFVGDLPLALALLGLVAVSGMLVEVVGIDPLIAGAVLLVGCLLLLVACVLRGSWSVRMLRERSKSTGQSQTPADATAAQGAR